MARELAVKIVGDSSSLERAFARSERSAKRFQTSMGRIGGRRRGGGLQAGAGLALTPRLLGLGALTIGLKQSVEAASDFQEQVSKTEVVFGKSSDSVKEWSKTTTEAFGTSRRQALATASSFGALFAPLGIVGAAAAKQSEKLTELGADLASFYNTNVQDALDAIRSGLVGEAEPLRRYGVLLSEARVQAQAMSDTGKKSATQLTNQEKAIARVEIIMKDTKQAQGDFARTSEDLSNQTKQLTANWDDFKVTMGETVIPVVNTAFTAFNDFFALLRDNAKVGTETFEKGSKLETTLVPNLAKQIGQMRKAGRSGKEIIATLRKQLGGSLKGDDLIAEAFSFFSGSDPKIRARIAKAIKGTKKTVQEEVDKQKKGPTAEQRNQWFDASIGRQMNRLQDVSLRKQAARLKTIANEVRARLAVTKDATRRLTLEDKLLEILREQKSVQGDIAAQIREANQALKDRAEAIKSAVIEKLQRRQTNVLNKRALDEAREQLRVARLTGGPVGLKQARQAVADARFDILRSRLEAAPATLTRGGQFAFGGVIINIHGVTDPEAVARRVADVLERKKKRTTTQSRGNHAKT